MARAEFFNLLEKCGLPAEIFKITERPNNPTITIEMPNGITIGAGNYYEYNTVYGTQIGRCSQVNLESLIKDIAKTHHALQSQKG